MHKKLFTVILFLAVHLCGLRAVAQHQESTDARYYQQQAAAAYKAKDYRALLINLEKAHALNSQHPSIIFNLGIAHALLGNKKEALDWLAKAAALGVYYPAATVNDLATLKDEAEFAKIVKRFEENRSPRVQSEAALTLAEKGLIPEGIAYDATDEVFYIGSVHKRKILAIDKKGTVSEFAGEREGLWSVLGMKVDAPRRILWVCSSAIAETKDLKAGEKGRAALFKFDLTTKKLVKSYPIDNEKSGHVFGDLALGANGEIYVSDSLTPAIYTLDKEHDRLAALVEGDPFRSPQGLDLTSDGKQLIVADYSRGIFVLELKTKKLAALMPLPSTTMLGIDGLYFYKGSLLAVQNGVNPHRVLRIYLNSNYDRVERLEIIEQANPVFDEPTLGVVIGANFYFVANSQWGVINEKGELDTERLKEPVILKIALK